MCLAARPIQTAGRLRAAVYLIFPEDEAHLAHSIRQICLLHKNQFAVITSTDQYHCPETEQLLITKGANLNASSNFDETPLKLLIRDGNYEGAQLLLTAGAEGKRYCLPHARVMIHQPWGGAQGTAMDMEIQIKETLNLKKRLETILASHCDKTQEELAKATERDNFLSPEEAKAFGLIDHIVTRADDSK